MIVVMESGASDQTVEAVIGFLVSAGFDVHLVKPVSFEQLEAVLRARTSGGDT